jgi:hypothetical protein
METAGTRFEPQRADDNVDVASAVVLPRATKPPMILPREGKRRSILDLETRKLYADEYDAAAMLDIPLEKVDRMIACGMLVRLRSALDIIEEAERDFYASTLSWRQWGRYHRLGLRFAEFDPQRLASVVAMIRAKAPRQLIMWRAKTAYEPPPDRATEASVRGTVKAVWGRYWKRRVAAEKKRQYKLRGHGATWRKILRFLPAAGSGEAVAPFDIVEATGLYRQAVHQALSRAVRDGRVKRPRYGVYALAA